VPTRGMLLAAILLCSACRAGAPLGGPGRTGEETCELDEVVGGIAEPAAREVVIARRKKAWEAALGGEEAARPHLRARLSGWPSRLLSDRASLPQTDADFAARLARDTWRGLEALVDREHALPIDNLRFGDRSVAVAKARIGDYTNITTVGLSLIAVVAAHELDFIERGAALERLTATLDTLDALETHRGFFFNYYDTTSLERTSNFLSFVDSSWLTAGLMVVRNAFPELHQRCAQLIGAMDYGLLYDAVRQRMFHGYYVHRASHSRYHYGVLYAESRLGSLIAIGKGDVPEAHWYRMDRTVPAACRWQTGEPRERRTKSVRGHRFHGGYYEWHGIRFVPSWGGSMFEALMPTLVLDELQHAPRGLGKNGYAHALVQQRYAAEELRYPVWGLSPSANPTGDAYAEYGVKPLGLLGYGKGAVTPHASALALSVTPDAALANLRRLAEQYDIYGEYGLYDAVEPSSGQVAHTYLHLDQTMTFIALANHLRPGCIQERFAVDPIALRALPLIRDEDMFQ
jgi:hypothetical protein